MEELELECYRHNPTFVRKPIEGGRFQLRKQCQLCGKVDLRNYKFSDVDDMSLVPMIDDILQSEYYLKRIQLYQEKREQEFQRKKEEWNNELEERRDKYEEYLNSVDWKGKRNRIIAKYNFKCVLCFKPAEVVHHLTYKRIYQEDERDLIPLCKSCHEFVHGYNTDTTPF
jgi:predicted HNH restriction endonuclease